MKLSEELKQRGFINQTSNEDLGLIFDSEKRVVYHGIEPTAESAHAGNFVIWMFLKHLANHGHKIIFLIGGGTGMIGDPKPESERELVDREVVKDRAEKIKQQAQLFFGDENISFVDNFDWLGKLDLITFLRDIGKHFTINELIKKDAISKRLQSENGISYTEFAYPLLQAYDFLKLFKDSQATLQIGGSDQWGNIISGVDLVRRVERATVFAVTAPLIVDKATGKKFGKSEGNAVWLSSEMTSPYDFFQFWLNVADDSVVEYLKLFTLLSLEEVEVLELEVKNNPADRKAQKALALAVTALVHGQSVADSVVSATELLFRDLENVSYSDEETTLLKQTAPQAKVSKDIDIVEVLVTANLASSKREARTFVESGAVYIDGAKVEAVDFNLNDKKRGDLIHLRRGKKNITLLLIE